MCVIRALCVCDPFVQALRTAIGNFYLALRGLDTVEDDMENFPEVAQKVAHLHAFHTYLNDPEWHLTGPSPSPSCVCVCVQRERGVCGL